MLSDTEECTSNISAAEKHIGGSHLEPYLLHTHMHGWLARNEKETVGECINYSAKSPSKEPYIPLLGSVFKETVTKRISG